MSDELRQLADVPREFVRDGMLFVNRCTKPDKKEFLKISQAVGMGFMIMGVIGYVIKLSAFMDIEHELKRMSDQAVTVHIPVNNILVGGA